MANKVLKDLSQSDASNNGEVFDDLMNSLATMSGSIRIVETKFVLARKSDVAKAELTFTEGYLAHTMSKDKAFPAYHTMAWNDLVLNARTILGKKGYSAKATDKASRQSEDEARWCAATRKAMSRLIQENTVRTPEEIKNATEKAAKAKTARERKAAKAKRDAKAELRNEVRKELDAVPNFKTFDDLLAFAAGEHVRLSMVIKRNASAHGSHADVFTALRSACDILATIPSPIGVEKKASKKASKK
jgi:hypothetical protein